MTNAIILHGRPLKSEYFDGKQPSASNAHWLPWIQKQLMVEGIKADTPEVPHAYLPQWGLWVQEVERFEIGPETTLIGHSTGGGFWIRYLSEHPELRVGKVILVAPWLNVKHEDPEISFFDFILDKDIAQRTEGVVIFNSDDDQTEIQDTVKHIKHHMTGVEIKQLHGRGHFIYESMHTDKFPELLKEILAK